MKKIRKWLCIVAVCIVVAVLGINFIVVGIGGRDIVSEKDVKKADCILVLGAQVKPDGTPSHMLRDRLKKGIELYKAGAAPKILMSGDNGQQEYNEVKVMLEYAREAGVPDKDIFLDHAGFSTYESMYRAKEIFGAEKIIVVTQKYHEYRALYIGQRLGMNVEGVCTDPIEYMGQFNRDIREVFARDKDFFQCIAKPEPTFLGDKIDLNGDGHETH